MRGTNGHWWIPLTDASDNEFWCFLDLRLNKRLSKQSRRRHLGLHCAHYDVTVMQWWHRIARHGSTNWIITKRTTWQPITVSTDYGFWEERKTSILQGTTHQRAPDYGNGRSIKQEQTHFTNTFCILIPIRCKILSALIQIYRCDPYKTWYMTR